MAITVVGLFENRDHAERAVMALMDAGLSRDEISVVSKDQRGAEPPDLTPKPGVGTAAGAGAGAAIGGMAGIVAGVAALAIPGIGPILAAGPVASALMGGAVGAAAGGLIGGLSSMGVDEEDARTYSEAVGRGHALVAVRATPADADRAADILEDHGAFDVDERIESWRTGTAGATVGRTRAAGSTLSARTAGTPQAGLERPTGLDPDEFQEKRRRRAVRSYPVSDTYHGEGEV